MDPRPRTTIDLLGMIATLRSGLLYIVALPSFVAVAVVAIFLAVPGDYGATARFAIPAQTYSQLNTTEFRQHVSTKVAERGGTSSSPLQEPIVSPRSKDGTASVSYTSPNEDEAILYVTVFAELATALATEEDINAGTMEQIEKRIELSIVEDYDRRISDAANAILKRIEPTNGLSGILNSSSDNVGEYAQAYKTLLDTLRSDSVYLRTEKIRLNQSIDDFKSIFTQTKVTSSSTARYRLIPILLASVVAAILLVATFLIAKASILRSSRAGQDPA